MRQTVPTVGRLEKYPHTRTGFKLRAFDALLQANVAQPGKYNSSIHTTIDTIYVMIIKVAIINIQCTIQVTYIYQYKPYSDMSIHIITDISILIYN